MNELKKIAPKLSKIKKEHPFGVPDNYFGDFSARLQNRLDAEKEVLPHQQSRTIRFLKPAIGLAASFLLIVMLVYWPLSTFLPDYLAKTNTAIEEVVDEEDTYITFFEKIDENTFFSILEEPVLSEETAQRDFNEEELLSYLSTNVSDYELYLQTEN